jgi:lysophospholipase L1-like esterase
MQGHFLAARYYDRMRSLKYSRFILMALAAIAFVLPGARTKAQTPPFDTSPEAVAARTAFYNVPGRAHLTGAKSPLTPGTRIDFFGDSITWLNGYVSNIQSAINSGAGTAGKGIVTINRGVDAAGVLTIRDGEQSTKGYGGVTPLPFATRIASDNADIAVVFIGINDTWWRGTPADTFRQGLLDLVSQAKTADVKMVLATLALNGEKPDGTNTDDLKNDQFAQITRDVTASTGTTLVDLRTALMYYEMNNNPYTQQRGRWTFQESGILTYDKIHPSALGNTLLSDLIAEGIYQAAIPEPTSLTLLAIGSVVLLRRRR